MRQKMDPNGVDKPVIIHRNDTSLYCTPPALIDIIRKFMPEELRLCSYEEGLQCSNCKVIDQRDSNGKVLWRKELCKCQDINQHGTCNLYLYRTSIYLGMHVYVQGNYKKAVCL